MYFYLDGKILYKRSFDETLLRCVKEKEVEQALKKSMREFVPLMLIDIH